MKLTDFNYSLPDHLIARYPLERRSASRLLCLNINNGEVQHSQFSNLIRFLKPNDLLVFNDTRVIPARLYGHKASGGKVEVLVERILDNNMALCMIRASKSPGLKTMIMIGNNIQLTIIGRKKEFFLAKFPESVLTILKKYGEIPLPPYFERKPEASDLSRYQTVYAKYEGAIAAPTAGLHFDEAILTQLKAKNIATAFVTLHVGAGTFQPVRTDNILEHEMHTEYGCVPQSVCDAISKTRQIGGRVIAVGTTSVRCLETAALKGKLESFQGDTNIFIYPGFQFNCVDAIITNFHLPKSTLMMLVSAFAGQLNIKRAYAAAIEEKYRFYSYGDAMFLANELNQVNQNAL